MRYLLKSPAKYVQGPNILGELDQYLQGMGKRPLVLLSVSGTKRIGPTLEKCFSGADWQVRQEVFQGECSQRQIDRLLEAARTHRATAVIGIGGGKILDTAKAVGHYGQIPVAAAPTVASSDSPCSSLSVIYHDDGAFDRYLHLDSCPQAVLADTAVIAKAPARLLAAGMGDAMATWFEARACRASGSDNQLGGKPTRAASGLARLCWDFLRRDGLAAMRDAESGLCSQAVETIVEVNTYLSSVGFESGGLAAAHGIQKGFTQIPALRSQLHGFNVAFCTLAQLVMEDSQEDLNAVEAFSTSIGLPICFADLGYPDAEPDAVRGAAEKACVPTSTIHHMPFEVTSEMVYQALMDADAFGRQYHQQEEGE